MKLNDILESKNKWIEFLDNLNNMSVNELKSLKHKMDNYIDAQATKASGNSKVGDMVYIARKTSFSTTSMRIKDYSLTMIQVRLDSFKSGVSLPNFEYSQIAGPKQKNYNKMGAYPGYLFPSRNDCLYWKLGMVISVFIYLLLTLKKYDTNINKNGYKQSIDLVTKMYYKHKNIFERIISHV